MTTFILMGAIILAVGLFLIMGGKEAGFSDMTVASGKMSWLPISGSLLATYIGPGLSIGLIGQMYAHGWIYPVLAGGYLLQLCFLGFFIGPYIKRNYGDCSSLGGILAQTVEHPSTLFLRSVGVFSALIMVGVCAIMTLIGGTILSSLLPISPFAGSIAVTIVVTGYTMAGGLKSSISTDNYQLAFFVAVVLTVLIATNFIEPRPNATEHISVDQVGWATALGIFLSFTVGEFLQPPFLQRIFSCNSERTVRTSFLVAALGLGIWFLIMGMIGKAGFTLLGPGTAPDDVFFAVVNVKASPVFATMCYIAVLLIVMSSQDSILNAASTVIVKDVMPTSSRKQNPTRATSAHRAMTMLVAVVALVLSQFFGTIMHGILFLASIWAPALLVPVVSLIVLRQQNHIPAIAAMFAGALSSLTWSLLFDNNLLPAILVGLTISAGSFFITLQFTENQVRQKT